MPQPINSYFDFAQLAMASYADFTEYLEDPLASELSKALQKDRDFPKDLADQFAGLKQGIPGYQVLDQRDGPFGFSATLFQDATGKKTLAIRGTNDPKDIVDDAKDVVVFGSTIFSDQYAALQNYYQDLIAGNLLAPSDQFFVTGHSFGGFLAQKFTEDHQDNILHTYTYNAPGFGGLVVEALKRSGLIPESLPRRKRGHSTFSGFCAGGRGGVRWIQGRTGGRVALAK